MTTQQTTVEQMNRVIAEFMGLTVIPSGTKAMGVINHPEIPEAFLKYHSSWDWLHGAWEKFRDMKIDLTDVYWCDTYDMHRQAISTALHAYPINVAFNRLYKAILWYNEHSKK